jgi:hypothetical protein
MQRLWSALMKPTGESRGLSRRHLHYFVACALGLDYGDMTQSSTPFHSFVDLAAPQRRQQWE